MRPLVVIELKNAADEHATTKKAFLQLQTYKQQMRRSCGTTPRLVVSDGITARIGTLTADWERFMPWRTVDGQTIALKGLPELDVLIKGVFEKTRFLDLLRHLGAIAPVPRISAEIARVSARTGLQSR